MTAVGIAASYFFFMRSAPSSLDPGVEVAPGFPTLAATSSQSFDSSPLEAERVPPVGYKEYRNTTHRFAVFYPEDISVHEFDEGGYAHTTTFQNEKTAQGFQVFVVPYSDTRVSGERFKMDAPSGVMKDPKNLYVDGAFATMFIGENSFLGPTREVWFIHGGYLFEITAPLSLSDWLGTIMSSWQFI